MQFSVIQSFDNYIEARIVLGRMQSEGINCWLQDEYTVTIDPILSNAIGGIKLMIDNADLEKAIPIYKQLEEEKKERFRCPQCGGREIEYITSTRKAANWITAIATWLLGNYAMGGEKVWHCFSCNAEFKEPAVVEGKEDEEL